MQRRTRPPRPLLPLLLRALLLRATAAAFSCATPLTFSQHRFPAILQLENACTETSVAVCLEFDGVVYHIHNMPASALYTVPTLLEDCWIFRAASCAGETLLEHAVAGTTKLTVGCTKAATDANSVQLVADSVPLDCSLTRTPALSDAYDASMDAVPADRRPDIASSALFADLDNPIQFVSRPDLLRGVYEMCFRLARHGVPVAKAFNVFRHVRAVVLHTENCRPELVGANIGIANAYLAVYGSAFAVMHAEADDAGTWVQDPAPLTPAQEAAVNTLTDYALSIDVGLPLPPDALPGAAHGVPGGSGGTSRVVVMQRGTVRRGNRRRRPVAASDLATDASEHGPMGVDGVPSREMRVGPALRTAASPSPEPVDGVGLCEAAGVGRWRFFKLSKPTLKNTTLDCCSAACFAFGKATRFAVSSFVTNCCLSCNMGSCSEQLTPRATAVLNVAEVQMPTNSTTVLEVPQRVMI